MFSPLNFKLYQHIQERLYFQYAIVFKQLASYLFKCKEPKPSFGFFFFFFFNLGAFPLLCCRAGDRAKSTMHAVCLIMCVEVTNWPRYILYCDVKG